MADVQLGDSIAVNGVCLTAVNLEDKSFSVDVSRETLNCTVGLEQQGAHVNLERPCAWLTGWAASGERPCGWRGRSAGVRQPGRELETLRARTQSAGKIHCDQGFVTINGVSLTVNRVEARYLT